MHNCRFSLEALASAGVVVMVMLLAAFSFPAELRGSSVRFEIDSGEYYVGEGQQTIQFWVLQEGELLDEATVDYATSSSVATPGVDYVTSSGTLRFEPGVARAFFTLQILNDAIRESTESVTLTLSNPTGDAVLGTRTRLVVQIGDNDAGVGFELGQSATVGESVGVFQLAVRRGTDLPVPVSVDYVVQDGTAVNGVDYVLTSGRLEFGPNEGQKVIPVPIINDGLKQSVQRFTVRLANPTGGVSLDPNARTFVFNIEDDDPGLSFTAAAQDVTESAGAAVVTVLRRDDLGTAATVDYVTTAGTAAAGSDFEPGSGTLVFAAGERTKEIVVPIVNSPDAEPKENFLLELRNATGGAAIGPLARTTVNILDNDGGIEFLGNAAVVNESDGVLRAQVVRGHDDLGPASVEYFSVDSSAVAGSDFTAVAGRLEIPAGETGAFITVPILNDGLREAVESFSLILTNATGAAGLGTRSILSVQIRSNDDGFRMDPSRLDAAEAAGAAVATILRGDDLDAAVSVDYVTEDISARAGEDYAAATGTVTFHPGEQRTEIRVTIFNDGIIENNETFRLALRNPSPGTSLASSLFSAIVTIQSDDRGFEFASATFDVNEGSTEAGITVARAGAGQPAGSVDFLATAGSAGAGSDFTPVSGTLTFAAGQSVAVFMVPLLNDGRMESTETVDLSLSNPIGSPLGAQRNATLRILDNEQPLGFAGLVGPVTVAENQPTLLLPVRRGDDGPDTVTVEYRTTAVSATPGADYSETSGRLSFPPGMATQTIAVPILNDALKEGPERFRVTLSGLQGGVGLSSATSVLVTIVDNDTGPVIEGAYLPESDPGVKELRVQRGDDSNEPVTLNYGVRKGSATPGADFVLASGALNFAPGAGSALLPITIIDDPLAEGEETVVIGLTNSVSGEVTEGTVSITDNERPIVLDPRFAPVFGPGTHVLAADRLANGQVVASHPGGFPTNQVVRLNLDGSADASFQSAVITGGEVQALVVLGDGRVLVGGSFTAVNGVGRGGVARLRADGALDASFDPGGGVKSGELAGTVRALALVAGDRVLVAGAFTQVNGVQRQKLARLESDGSVDSSYDPSGALGPGFGSVAALLPLADGVVLVGGALRQSEGAARNGLLRLNGDGSVDAAFDARLNDGAEVQALALQADGRILIGGLFENVGDLARRNIARLNADGGVDAGFDPKFGQGQPVLALGVQPDGRVLIGGAGLVFDNFYRAGVARLYPDGVVDRAFTVGAQTTRGILLGADRTAVIFGTFDGVWDSNVGLARRGIARFFLENSGLSGVMFQNDVQSADEAAQGSVGLLVQRLGDAGQPITVEVATSGGDATAGVDYRILDGSLTLGPLEGEKNLLIQVIDDGVVDAGERAEIRITSATGGALLGFRDRTWLEIRDNEIAAVVDRSFNPPQALWQNIQTAVVLPDGRTVLSAWMPNGPPQIFRLNADGSLDATFRKVVTQDGAVRSMAVDAQGRIVIAGDFYAINDVQLPASGLARLGVDGSIDSSFRPPTDLGCCEFSLAIEPDGQILVLTCNSLIRLNPDGAKDASFVAQVPDNVCAQALALQADGRIVVGFPDSGNPQQSLLLRFMPDGALDRDFHTPVFEVRGDCCPVVSALLVQPDRKLVVAGRFSHADGLPRGSVVRLNNDGTVDVGFVTDSGARWDNGDGTPGQPANVQRLAIDAASRALVSGYFAFMNGVRRDGLARLNADGTLDASFGPTIFGGEWWRAPQRSPVALPDGNVLIYGSFASVNGIARNGMARLYGDSSRTSLEWTDNRFTQVESAPVATVTVMRLGDVTTAASVRYATGAGSAAAGQDFQSVGGVLDFAPLELRKTISVPLLDDELLEPDETASLTLSDATGVSLIGLPQAVLRILDDERPGSLDGSFALRPEPDENGWAGYVVRNGIEPLDDGRVLVSGEFRWSADVYRNGMRLHADGTPDSSFERQAGYGFLKPLASGRILTQASGSGGTGLMRLLPDGKPDATFVTRYWNGDLRDAAELADGRLLVLASVCNPSPCRVQVHRLLSDGSEDPSFTPITLLDSNASSMLLAADGAVVIVGSGGISSPLRQGIALVNPAGLREANFPQASVGIDAYSYAGVAVELLDGSILAGGYFNLNNNRGQVNLLRFERDGRLVAGFRAGKASQDEQQENLVGVNAVAEQADGKLLVAGAFRFFNGVPRADLVRLHPDGTVDTTFDIGEGLLFADSYNPNGYSSVEAVAVLANGQILVGGGFNRVNGAPRNVLARLQGDGQAVFTGLEMDTPSSAVRLDLRVHPNRTYRVDYSADLSQWVPLSTNRISGTALRVEDAGAAAQSQRFYRAVKP
jgi:uncharacterized delta-60 repeat protein